MGITDIDFIPLFILQKYEYLVLRVDWMETFGMWKMWVQIYPLLRGARTVVSMLGAVVIFYMCFISFLEDSFNYVFV